jgi:hypothetical protein
MIRIVNAPINLDEYEKYINEVQALLGSNWLPGYKRVYGDYVFNAYKFTQLIGSNRIGSSQSVKILQKEEGDTVQAIGITITDLDFLTSKTKETLVYCVGENAEGIQAIKQYLIDTKGVAKVDEIWENLPLEDGGIIQRKVD